MDIGNAEHAEAYFPKRSWAMGEIEFSFSQFEWDSEKRVMLYAGGGFRYGEIAEPPRELV